MEERTELLRTLDQLQQDTASITLRLGGTDSHNIVEHDSLYLLDCPAKVVSALEEKGYSLSVGEEGVRVRDYRR